MHYPESKKALQDIIKAAREKGTALVPVSSGAPHIHGISENKNAETVDMSKMNNILKISRHDRYARVEVGVTFGDLIPEMAKNGLRLNAPFLPRANKSAIASALEREAVLVPKYQYDYTDPLLTMEVVFGTGDEFRTGSASGPGTYEELKADMVSPWGPGTIDYLRFVMGAQGTMGIATWGTLKAEVMPSQSKLFFIEADDLWFVTAGFVSRLAQRMQTGFCGADGGAQSQNSEEDQNPDTQTEFVLKPYSHQQKKHGRE